MNKILNMFLLVLLFLPLFSCGNTKKQNGVFKVGLFIPGVLAGSSTYEMMKQAGDEITNENSDIEIKIFEAGYNQSKWLELLTSFTASDNFDVILTSNPALPEICNEVSKQFQNQKFLITDAYYSGGTNIATYMFNQYEQSYLLGYIAALISESKMNNTIPSKKIGFLIAQEFPIMTKHILPGFLDGAKKVSDDYKLDLRVIGNWYDTSKAYDLTKSMIQDGGVNVLGVTSGASSQGAIKAASEFNRFIVYHNIDEYEKARGVILACGIMELKKLTKQIIIDAKEKKIEYGKNETFGFESGYIGFADTDIYREYMPKTLQEKIETMKDSLKTGKIKLVTPSL